MEGNDRKTNAKFTEVGFGAAYFSIAVMSMLFAAVLFSFALQTIFGQASAVTENDWYKFASYLITPAALAVSGVLFCKSFGESIPNVCRINKAEKRHYAYAVILAVGMFCGLSSVNTAFIEMLTEKFGYVYTETTLPSFSVVNFILTVITVCVIPAIFEELFFRGILLKSLSGSGMIASSIISGVYFSLFHMNPSQTPYQFIVGVLFGLSAYSSGSVKPTCLAHFLNNFIIVVLNYACPSFGGFSGIALAITEIIGVLCLVIFIFFVVKEKHREQKSAYPFDFKTFFLYSAIGLAACVAMWIAGLAL